MTGCEKCRTLALVPLVCNSVPSAQNTMLNHVLLALVVVLARSLVEAKHARRRPALPGPLFPFIPPSPGEPTAGGA